MSFAYSLISALKVIMSNQTEKKTIRLYLCSILGVDYSKNCTFLKTNAMETKLCSSVILIYGWVKSDKFDLMIMLRLSFSPPHHNSSFVIILLPIAPLSLSLFLISPSSPWFLNSVHLPLLPPFYPFSLSSWGTPARIPFILFFLLPPPLPLSISHYLHVQIYIIYTACWHGFTYVWRIMHTHLVHQPTVDHDELYISFWYSLHFCSPFQNEFCSSSLYLPRSNIFY